MSAMSGFALSSVGTAEADRPDDDGFDIKDSTGQETARVVRSRQFREIAPDLPNRRAQLDFRRAKTVRKQEENDNYKLAVPLKVMDSFDPLSTAEGLHAHVERQSKEIQIIVRYEYNEVEPADLGKSNKPNEVYAASTNKGSSIGRERRNSTNNSRGFDKRGESR